MSCAEKIRKLKVATLRAVKKAYQLGRHDGNLEKLKMQREISQLKSENERLKKVEDIKRELEAS